MKKLFIILFVFVATLALSSCGRDDFYDPYGPYQPDQPGQNWSFDDNKLSNQLSQTEKNLVGSYISDDGQEPVIYLTLSENRSGSYTSNGATSSFSWYVDGSNLYMKYSDNKGEYYTITYDSSNRLCLNNIPFVANNKGDGQETSDVLVGQWQGKMADNFYTEMYNFESAEGLATIFEFAADGTGAQLDYDEAAALENHSVLTFTWIRNGNTISLNYNDPDKLWSSANINSPMITSGKFTGSISYTGYANSYKFSFASVTGFDWSPYLSQSTEAKTTRSIQKTSRMEQLRLLNTTSESKGSFKR